MASILIDDSEAKRSGIGVYVVGSDLEQVECRSFHAAQRKEAASFALDLYNVLGFPVEWPNFRPGAYLITTSELARLAGRENDCNYA